MEEFKRGTGGAMLGGVGRTEQGGGDAVEDASRICPSTYSLPKKEKRKKAS